MRLVTAVIAGAVAVGALVVGVAAPASAHVLPSTSVVLDVTGSSTIDAELRIPVSDLESASGIDLGDASAAEVSAAATQLRTYIAGHFQPTSSPGGDWDVTVGNIAVTTSEQLGTGAYQAVTATAHLVAPAGVDDRVFDLGYDVVVHRVITHVVIVSVRTDWSTGTLGDARQIGTVSLNTVTGDITPLTVNLGDGSDWQGFSSMVSLGVRHIREGTDHQLFLLTLLLPAPLLVARRRWATPSRPGRAVRRIASITLAFTVGHSVTLALGALGLPVPQQAIEALIAVSILVAAVHAIRPIFAGKEVVIAAGFGLVHGLAFSQTLSELQLTGGQLVLSLLGFNLGIELMQLAIVAVVLPPLIVLARTPAYRRLRIVAAIVTAIAAVGWLGARVGIPNAIADAADSIGSVSPYLVVALWIAAACALVASLRELSRRRTRPTGAESTDELGQLQEVAAGVVEDGDDDRSHRGGRLRERLAEGQ